MSPQQSPSRATPALSHSRPGDDARKVSVDLKVKVRGPAVKLAPKINSDRLIVWPSEPAGEALDITDSLIGAIARELWNRRGGNDIVNWLEAESLLQQLLERRAVALPPGTTTTPRETSNGRSIEQEVQHDVERRTPIHC